MSPRPPIPFSEPPYLCGLPSPYYTLSHLRWQKACRAFLEEHFLPYAVDWERGETVPPHVFETFAKHNMLIPNLPAALPIQWLKSLGIHDVLGAVKVEEWYYLHTGIYIDEMARSGLAGPSGSLTVGMACGIPPLIKFASRDLQSRYLPELLTGKKRTCIAITEPNAGSDVATISTTATKSADGQSYIVNGTKNGSQTPSGPTAPAWRSVPARLNPVQQASPSSWSPSNTIRESPCGGSNPPAKSLQEQPSSPSKMWSSPSRTSLALKAKG